MVQKAHHGGCRVGAVSGSTKTAVGFLPFEVEKEFLRGHRELLLWMLYISVLSFAWLVLLGVGSLPSIHLYKKFNAWTRLAWQVRWMAEPWNSLPRSRPSDAAFACELLTFQSLHSFAKPQYLHVPLSFLLILSYLEGARWKRFFFSFSFSKKFFWMGFLSGTCIEGSKVQIS